MADPVKTGLSGESGEIKDAHAASKALSHGEAREMPVEEGGRLQSASGLWWLLAVGLAILATLWVFRDEVVYCCIQVGGAVPPIPALAAILVLLGAAYLATRRRDASARRRYILWVFLLIAVTASISSPATEAFFVFA